MKLQNMIDYSNNDVIISFVKCDLKSYPNKSEWCHIIDNVPLKFFSIHIKAWSIAIDNGTAIMDMPPAIIIKSLIPAKLSLSNPLEILIQNC